MLMLPEESTANAKGSPKSFGPAISLAAEKLAPLSVERLKKISKLSPPSKTMSMFPAESTAINGGPPGGLLVDVSTGAEKLSPPSEDRLKKRYGIEIGPPTLD